MVSYKAFWKYFYSPLLVALVFIFVAFLLYFGQILNVLGISVFLVFAFLFNLFWVAFFAYVMEKFFDRVMWLTVYAIWLVSVAFFLWAMYDKMLVNLDFYRDIAVLVIGAGIFFQGISDKKWIAFALGMTTAYIYYASLRSSLLFYVLVVWLIIDGWHMDYLVNKYEVNIGKALVLFAVGLAYLPLAMFIANYLKDLIIR